MTPSASLLLLLLLGLSQAHPLQEGERREAVQDTVDITTMILTTNNGSDETLLQGDLLLPKTRSAIKCPASKNCFWPKTNGLVNIPFTISSDFTSVESQRIISAMQGFYSKTCIRFVPRQNQPDYISIQSQKGCYSYLGRQGGSQVVSLKRQGCLYYGVIQHELNHALGFQHEHVRMDRDSYVMINWQNIDPSMAYNFNKAAGNDQNTAYDYSSIMHYGKTAFSNQPGKDSITPIPNPNVQIGQIQGLSNVDIVRINNLYNC